MNALGTCEFQDYVRQQGRSGGGSGGNDGIIGCQGVGYVGSGHSSTVGGCFPGVQSV